MDDKKHPSKARRNKKHTAPAQRQAASGQKRVAPGQNHAASGQKQTPPAQRQAATGQSRAASGQTHATPAQKQASRPRRRKKPITVLGVLFYLIFVIGVSALLAGVGWVWANDVLALNKASHSAVITLPENLFSDKVVTVKNETDKGIVTESKTVSVANMNAVADLLKEKGIIEYKPLFYLYAALSNAEEKLSPGTYELNTDMDYRAIVTNMGTRSSSRLTVKVTIPEGYTLAQTFRLLEEKGVTTVAKLNEQAANYDYAFSFLQDIPLGRPSRLEGYLFPDTYEFYLGEDAKTVINKMLVNFDARVTDELRRVITEEKGMTIHDIVIMASLIEKETDGADQTKIASVIYNRLNSNVTGGKLEIDATVQYVLPERKEKLTYEDLEIDSLYNTYKYAGLPIGPIANPGMTAIRAAIYPANTKNYWYVLGDDKVHHFFSNYDKFVSFKKGLSGS